MHMKFVTRFWGGVWLLGCVLSSQAAFDLHVDVPVGQAIPDGDPGGMASVVNISVPCNQIVPGSLTVNLNITGTYSGDLYAYLVHGSGFAVLLNRVGVSATDSLGYGDSGLNVQFSDGAANGNIHFYQQVTAPAAGSQLTGAWAPDGRAASPFAVTGREAATATLSSFNGIDPNGEWVLYVADVSGGDLHSLVSWSLEMEAVPEAEWYGLWAGLLILASGAGRKLLGGIRQA